MNIENLKKARESKGYTQAQAAEAVGVSDGTYKNYEQGKREPNGDKMVTIAIAFGTTTDFLLGKTTKMEPPEESQSSKDPQPIDQSELLETEMLMLRAYLTLPKKKREHFFEGVLADALRTRWEQTAHAENDADKDQEPTETTDKQASASAV